MLTTPTNLVQREVDSSIKLCLDKMADLIEELVNYGSTIMLAHSPSKSGEDGIAPIMLFRHYLDILDSLSILTRKGAGEPSKILVRSAWETKLAILYIFEKKTLDRSLAFLIVDIVSQIRKVKQIIPNTAEGDRFYSIMNRDGYLKDVTITKEQLAETFEFINKKEAMLQPPPFTTVYKEFLNRSKKDAYLKWYSLFDGPKTLLALSKYLNEESFYKLMYNEWSEAAHASNVYRGKVLRSEVEGIANFVQLRFAKDMQDVVKNVLPMTLTIFRSFLDNRIPEKRNEFTNWWLQLKPHVDELMTVNYFQVH